MIRGGTFGAVLAAASLAVVPASAQAGPSLASDNQVFPAPAVDASGPTAAFAPNGYGAVAWVETLPGSQARVDVALRPPGGAWSAPQLLATSSRSLAGADVAIDSNGDAAVSWSETQSPSTFVGAVATRPAGGVFGAPEFFDGGYTSRVAVDATGQVTFLYQLINSGPQNGEYARTAAAGSSLTAASADTLTTGCQGYEADLMVNPSGDAIAGYGFGCFSFAVRHGGVWTTSTPFQDNSVSCPTVSTNTTYSGVRVAIDEQGHAAGAVARRDYQNDCSGFGFTPESHSIVLALLAGGTIVAGPTVAASGSGNNFSVPNDVRSPTVGVGGGSVIVGWAAGDSNNGSTAQPATRTYTSNGLDSPGPAQPMGTLTGGLAVPQVLVGGAGQAVMTWLQPGSGGHSSVFAAYRPPGGSFTAPAQASDGSTDVYGVDSTLNASGDGLLAWIEGGSAPRIVHARGFDSTPPQLSGVSIPATADTVSPTAFAAQATDVWGPVTFAWNFGDGTADGPTPSHTFAAGGPHTVTVTASDSAGNTASQTGTVDVAPPPSPASPAFAFAPRLTALSETKSIFRVGPKPTPVAAARKKRRAPTGTTFRFTVDQVASIAIRIGRALPGRRSGKRCVKPTKKLARSKPCTRYAPKGRLTRAGKAGANRVAFSGRIGKRALTPGKYRATFVPTAGGKVGASKALRFTIVR